jgi:hypothetical protein
MVQLCGDVHHRRCGGCLFGMRLGGVEQVDKNVCTRDRGFQRDAGEHKQIARLRFQHGFMRGADAVLRPWIERRRATAVEARIRALKAEGMGMLKIGRIVGVGTSAVRRVLAAPLA